MEDQPCPFALVRVSSGDKDVTAHLAKCPDLQQERKHVFPGEVGNAELDDDAFIASFTLPSIQNKFETLRALNPFPCDSRIDFFEEEHYYEIDQVRAPRSVTSIVHQFETPFDAEAVIKKMKLGQNWETKRMEYCTSDDEEMSDVEIKARWARIAEIARKRGTHMHWIIEMFCNGAVIHGPFPTEFKLFMEFYESFMVTRSIIPVRTEMSIFHCGLICAGQIDLLAKYNGTEDYVIIDWKRSKEIKEFAYGRTLATPFNHLPHTNLSAYTLQLNIYRYILQTEYGLRVIGLYLGVFHPNQTAPRVVAIPLLDIDMELLVKHEITTHNCSFPVPFEHAPFRVDRYKA